MIRQPIIAVLGHVDHGKTLLLDRIRNSNVTEKEAGKITQHIGATEIPANEIKKISSSLLNKFGFKVIIPGLLFIDTPGHESFTNLRKRGGNIADLAILVIDINQGIESQTKESIEIFKKFKTPFVIALNKIDKLYDWKSIKGSFLDNLKNQNEKAQKELDEKLYELVAKLYELGFNSERFDRIEEYTKQIPIIPCSAMTGEGIPEILMMLTGLTQKFLNKSLQINENEKGKGTVLEVKEEKGLGPTIDVILYDGNIKTNEKIMLAGKNNLIKTKIKALLKPAALQEMRLGLSKFKKIDKVTAAAGIKIAATNLEKSIAGSPLFVYDKNNEKKVEEEIKKEIKQMTIQSENIGVIVKADSLGSLEAIINLFDSADIKIRKAEIGEVTKKDVMEALTVKEKDEFKGVIFAFNVKIDNSARNEEKKREVKIFPGKVIYKLIEDYKEWVKEKKDAEKNQNLKKLVFPAKIKFLKGFIFRQSNPAVIGVQVIEGKIKPGVKLMKNNKVIGEIKGIQSEGKEIKKASKGEKVAISVSNAIANKTIFEGDEFFTVIPQTQFKEIKKYLDLNSEEEEILEEIKKIEGGGENK